MRDPVAHALERDLLEEDYAGRGVFLHHLGDAPAWAGVLLAERMRGTEVLPRDRAVLEGVLRRVRRLLALGARSRREWEEAGLGLLALVAAFEVEPRRRDARRVGAALTLANGVTAAQGGRLRVPVGAFGPASLTAALAYGNLRWADALGNRRAERYRRAGERMLRRLAAEPGLHGDDGSGKPEALPNLLTAAAFARGGRVDAARDLLERAGKELRAPGGAWLARAPQEDAGGPRFLSIQNFAAFAWWEIARQSGERADVREARDPVSWSFEHLLHDGRLRHHLNADGTPSRSYCSGCNLQALAIRQALAAQGAYD